jgi:outer membrane protein assembly factor BamB
MRSVFLFALAAVLSAALSAQQSSTFFSTFDAGRGSVIAPAAGGNLWLGGQKDERVLLVKLNPEGKTLEKHSVGFEGLALDGEHLTDLFEEPDGTLVGCGNFEGDNLGRGFVFRYNPATRQTLWAHVVRSGSLNYLYGITQLGPEGDYVLYGNPHNTAGDDAELLQLSRTTGQIVTGKAKRFGIGPADNIVQALYHNGAMYTCGRFTGTEFYPPARMRNAVCKIDTATLEPIWTRTGPLLTSSSGQFHGRDLIIDNETIVSTFSGDHASPDLVKSEVYLQKNDLDGNLLWVRQYKLPAFAHEFAEEIINLPDGYLLYGHDVRADTSRLFLLKTDKEGNAATAAIIDFGLNDEFPEIPARSKILRLGDALFFTALSENNLGQTQGILVKADLNSLLVDSCDFVRKTPVTFSDWDSAVSQSFVPTVTAGTASLAAATISQTTPDLTFEKKCGATGTCPTLPDLSVKLDSITCTDGNSRLHFTVCNVGGQPYDGPSTFFLYDQNPLTGPAKFITGSIGGGLPILPGECISWGSFGSDVDLLMPFELDTFTRLYALIGANYTATTPIPISGFPYPPNQPECNYLNNLDSISIPQNLCGDCQTPVTFVKKLGAPQRRELAFSMCTSADGNVYVAGKQGNNPMIAKITTQGEQIWVRNFPPINPNEPIEWAQIIEDSDGKIVVCGTEGASPSNRRAIVMRYDPVAGAVLWYKRYQSDKPTGVAIVEKSPGGDFVLQANYQTVGSGGVSAQTQFFTLNRADGNTKGSSVGYQSQDNNIVISSTVLNNGKLYTVGSWVTKTNDKALPFIARVSPNTFFPEWAYLSIPDTSSGAARWMPPADVAFDGDIAIIAGSGHLNPLTPTENIFVYLQKHNPDGSLVWLKRYDMEMVPEEVLALPNAYIVFGRMVGTNRFGMLKTDLQGNVLRAAVLEAAPTSPNSVGFVSRQGLLLRLPLQLLMLDHTWDNTESDLVLLRTDLNFGLDDDCDLLQTVQVSSSTLSATTEPALFGIGTNTPASVALPANAVFQADSLPLRKLCPDCSCADKPDISFGVTEIQCAAGNIYEFKTKTCNTGDVAAPTPVGVVFYDKNPLTEAATVLWSITVNQPPGPGGCIETTESLPAVATQYPKIYAFAGVPASTTTPIDLGLLAANTDFPDCHWENNLDSFAIDPTLCPADSCQPNTFLKVYGEIIKQDNIAALRAAPDGNIYVAGGKADGYAIGKMTPTGNMLWLHNITGTIQDRIFVTEIIVDSEGMIVGSAHRNSSTGVETVAFRYNPATNQILWEQRFGVNNPIEGGILEKKPGGNYLIYHSPDYNALGHKSVEILELNRTTGQIVPAFAKRYAQQDIQVFAGMVQHDDALYATGYTDSLLPTNQRVRRITLTKLDANTGNVLWTRLGLTPWSQTSYFRGIDLIVDDNSLIVLSHGIETSNTPTGSGKVVPVYLHKTTLDGDLLWAKKYLLTEVPREVVAVPDGYVIFCGNNKRHFLKTDKEGDLLFAKALNTPDYFSAGYEDLQKNQIERVGSYLYITDFSAKGNTAGQFTTVLKTDLNLGLEFDCGLELLAVSDTAMTNPVLFAAQQTATTSPATAQAVTLTNAPGSIAVHSACPFCPDPPCSDKPDISFRIESVGCDSAAFVAYRLCNTGKQPFTGTLQVGVYDSNPMTGAATQLDLFLLPTLNLAPDSCQTGTLPNLSFWGNYNKVYTLAGIKSGQTTPVNLAGFPYNGIAECDYTNNFDSLAFQYPPAPQKPDLGPDRILCAGQSVLLNAGTGFVAYKWSNGPTTQTVAANSTGIIRVEATDACGRILRDTVSVTVLPPVVPTTVTIQFYPGDTVMLAGVPYTQPDTITQTLTTGNSCDSVVTYILQRIITNLDLACPPALTVTVPANASSAPVAYPLPAAATDCPGPGIALTRLQGPPPGGQFPLGNTLVCHEAANQCGIRDTCCFTVTVQKAAVDETACDVKTPVGGCIKYEILSIRLDSLGRPRYRFRLTNTCASPLRYACFQLPDGITAKAPVEGSTYTAVSGNTYLVRNPNAAPFHSVRFKSTSGALNNGKSDVFEYTLPKQAQPLFILVSVKLEDGSTYDAHLNTFACPVQPYVASAQEPAGAAQNRGATTAGPALLLRPNPTSGLLLIDLQTAEPDSGQPVQISVLNALGQLVLEGRFVAENNRISLLLPEGLANGLYYLTAQSAAGGMQPAARFVLER